MKRPYQQIMNVENKNGSNGSTFATFKTSFLTLENAINNALEYAEEWKKYGRIVTSVKVINKETKEVLWTYTI